MNYLLPTAIGGIDIIHYIREQFGMEVPAILLTGDIALRAEGGEGQGHSLTLLIKPVRMKALKAEIEMLLNAQLLMVRARRPGQAAAMGGLSGAIDPHGRDCR